MMSMPLLSNHSIDLYMGPCVCVPTNFRKLIVPSRHTQARRRQEHCQRFRLVTNIILTCEASWNVKLKRVPQWQKSVETTKAF